MLLIKTCSCQVLDHPVKGRESERNSSWMSLTAISLNLREFCIKKNCGVYQGLLSITTSETHFLLALGVSAGLFGTNDNEAGNEWMLPDHSCSTSMQEFTHRWQVSQKYLCRGNSYLFYTACLLPLWPATGFELPIIC